MIAVAVISFPVEAMLKTSPSFAARIDARFAVPTAS